MSPAKSNFVIAIPKKDMGDVGEPAPRAKPLPGGSSEEDDTPSTSAGPSIQTTARTTPSSRLQELSASPFAMGNSSRRKRKLEESEMTAPLPTASATASDQASNKALSVLEISDDESISDASSFSDIPEATRTGIRNEGSNREARRYSSRLRDKRSRMASPSPTPYSYFGQHAMTINDTVDWDSANDDDDYYGDEYASSDNSSADTGSHAHADGASASVNTHTARSYSQYRHRYTPYRRTRPIDGPAERAARERSKLEKQHPFVKNMWEDMKNIPVIKPIAGSQPSAITRSLKPFQLEGLDWMVKQEASQWKGGLLGDEMGMGKTIQAVSLLMSDFPAGLPSLVVVPPVALMQWQSEIKSYTNDKLKVLIHHNSSTKTKLLSQDDLARYDVIIISYSGLESLYRKQTKGWNRGGNVVKEDSPIHAIHYHRLILDEAHNIKQRTTSVAKACFALKANYKWCLSGTPVQNRIGEFFSLLRFLDVRPFACYLCKSCKCQTLQWSQDKQKRCTQCHHSGFSHVSLFNQEILNPLTHAESTAPRQAAFDKLRLITDRVMLRRVKRDHTQSMELPPKKIVLNTQFFGEIERDFSSSIMTNSTRQFETYVSRGVMLSNYANIFGLIMQMRQVANHPDLIVKKHAEGNTSVLVCCICDEPADEPIRSRCSHEFCRQCAREYIFSYKVYGEPDCPRCHIPLTIDLEQPECEQPSGET